MVLEVAGAEAVGTKIVATLAPTVGGGRGRGRQPHERDRGMKEEMARKGG